MTGGIFISYRREDAGDSAGRLFDWLGRAVPGVPVFMDVEGSIGAGQDFAAAIEWQVAACDVLLAVVGRHWSSVADSGGRRRLDDEADFVRLEIASALALGKRVIPVLVGGTPMPAAAELPPPLAGFVRLNAVRLTIERYAADFAGLVDQLRPILLAAAAERARREAEASQEARAAANLRQEQQLAPFLLLADHLGAAIGELTYSVIDVVRLRYCGAVAHLPVERITDRFLLQVFNRMISDLEIDTVRATVAARGVAISEDLCPPFEAFDNYIEVEIGSGEKLRKAGGALSADGRPRIVHMRGIRIEFEVAPYMIYVRANDAVHVVANLGIVLAEAGINIANIWKGRDRPGADAVYVAALDAPAPDAVIDRLRQCTGMVSAAPMLF